HHLDRATCQAERHRPNGILAHPVDGLVYRGEHHTLRRGIAESQIPDDSLPVLGGDIRAKTARAGHRDILNHFTAVMSPPRLPPSLGAPWCESAVPAASARS